MRALDIALASLALRATRPRDPDRLRDLVPAVDEPTDAMLDRAALSHQHAALIASLWPAGRPCVVGARYELLPAPAQFITLYRVNWPGTPVADARMLQQRLRAAFAEGEKHGKAAEKAKAAA